MGFPLVAQARNRLKSVLIAKDETAIARAACRVLALLPALTPAGAIGAVTVERIRIAVALGREALVLFLGGRTAVAIAGDEPRFVRQTAIGSAGGKDRKGDSGGGGSDHGTPIT